MKMTKGCTTTGRGISAAWIILVICFLSHVRGNDNNNNNFNDIVPSNSNRIRSQRAATTTTNETPMNQGSRELQDYSITIYVIDTLADVRYIELQDGVSINMDDLDLSNPESLNFEGVASGGPIGYFNFTLDTHLYPNRIERNAPYALCGNRGPDFMSCPGIKYGKHELSVNIHSKEGDILKTNTYTFYIINANHPRPSDVIEPPPIFVAPPPVNPPPVPAPVEPPVPAPVEPPVPAPVEPPVPAPVEPPVPAPVEPPVPAPVEPPVPAPVEPPVPPPVEPPVPPPVEPVANTQCSVPKFIGEWERWTPYPIPVAESLGALVGKDYVIVSGYTEFWNRTTKQVFAYDTTQDPATGVWRPMDDVPVEQGFSHSSYAVNGLTLYICGGYIGPVYGPESDTCLQLDTANPLGSQWSFLPNLPEGRGGGGLFYMKSSNSLLYATGAIRPHGDAFDKPDAWELSFNELWAGWQRRPDVPYSANHVSHVTANYQGKERHYILGGQLQQREAEDNLADNVEWDDDNKQWIRRAYLPFGRGHSSSSTVGYGCGFIMAGGAVNGNVHTSDISYYGIDTDSFTKIGDLPEKINTPTCDIVNLPDGDWLYCQSGWICCHEFSWKIWISL